MGMFDIVTFGPDDVKAVHSGQGTRSQIISILTSQTCGEPCWHAREEICRCSCGGKNHGCLTHGGERPERHAKIDGIPYKLAGVGPSQSLRADADKINCEAGYRSVDRACVVIDGIGSGQKTADEIALARSQGKEVWWQQYRYQWRETDSHAPARVKYPSASQRKWTELAAFADDHNVALLWVRVEMPKRPEILVVDRETGEPLANQNPD